MANSPTSTTNHSSVSAHHSAGVGALGWIALVLMIVGAVNWGLVGVANFDLVATLFGEGSALSRIVYSLVGLAGLYGIYLATKLGDRG